ncbi:hypothetical protein AX767_06035 [Variovorax sp. PAMC 28711]|nr:hypothetical protein AX767_06035 [Variovorax sp. PAMC 28711]
MLVRSFAWRRDATHGVKNAREKAQAHEAEIRRRFTDTAPTECGTLEAPRVIRRSAWRLW